MLISKKCKLVRDLVNLDEPVGKAWIKGRSFQTILAYGRGKVVRLNRLPVFLHGECIDIMDMLHNSSLVVIDDDDSPNEGKTRSRKVDGDTLIPNLVRLENHVKYFMRTFSTYFMLPTVTTKQISKKHR